MIFRSEKMSKFSQISLPSTQFPFMMYFSIFSRQNSRNFRRVFDWQVLSLSNFSEMQLSKIICVVSFTSNLSTKTAKKRLQFFPFYWEFSASLFFITSTRNEWINLLQNGAKKQRTRQSRKRTWKCKRFERYKNHKNSIAYCTKLLV